MEIHEMIWKEILVEKFGKQGGGAKRGTFLADS